MMGRHVGRWTAALALAATAVTVGGSAPPALAHDTGGLFQPRVSDLVVQDSGTAGERDVWLRVVDADSGTPAEGMRTTLATPKAAVPLAEVGLGYFSGSAPVDPGPTRLTVTVEAAPGGPLSKRFTTSWTVDIPPLGQRKVVAGSGNQAGFDAAGRSPRRGALAAAADAGKGLDVALEAVDDKSLASPLYVRVHARIQVRGLGRLDPTPYEVYGWATDATGAETEFVRFSPLDVVDPAYAAGVYGGVVILSHGGDWTVKATVLQIRQRPHDPPIPITGSQLALARSGPALAQAGAGVDRLARPRVNIFNTVVLGLHSLAAAAWALVLGVLFLLTYERGRALSGWARTRLEQNLDRLVRAAWVTSFLVIWTGIHNLYRESPYHRIPMSWASLQGLLRQPYGRPYYLALAVKLTAYGVLLVLGSRLIRSARRATGATRPRPAGDLGASPWARMVSGAPSASSASSPASGAMGSVATAAPPAVAVEQLAEPEVSVEPGWRASWLVPVALGCGAAIITCVTVLKTVHLLIELTRVAS